MRKIAHARVRVRFSFSVIVYSLSWYSFSFSVIDRAMGPYHSKLHKIELVFLIFVCLTNF